MAVDDHRDIAKAAEARRREVDRDDLQHEIGGQETGRAARFFTAPQGQQDGKSAKGRKQARADTDAFYMALMQEGAFGGFVVGEVFGGKSDAEIAGIVSEIEDRTGMSFTDYAAKILGPDAVQRLPGESDADYHRRLVMAIAEEIIDPRTGRIKPKYADDPMAAIILRDATYRSILADVARINRGDPGPRTDRIVAEHRDAGYDSAELAAHRIDDAGHKGDLRDGQNDHADRAYGSDAMQSESDGFFGAPDATADAAKAGRHAFNESAPDRSKPPTDGNEPFDPSFGKLSG